MHGAHWRHNFLDLLAIPARLNFDLRIRRTKLIVALEKLVKFAKLGRKIL